MKPPDSGTRMPRTLLESRLRTALIWSWVGTAVAPALIVGYVVNGYHPNPNHICEISRHIGFTFLETLKFLACKAS